MTTLTLSQDGQDNLIKLAKATLYAHLQGNPLPSLEGLGIPLTEELGQALGAFVTLRQHGDLRGCIGCMESNDPLHHNIAQYAITSAVSDHRFRPVTLDEYPSLNFEISVLGPRINVPGYSDIDINRHGIVLAKHGRSALFLPKVATEQGWDLNTTLQHLCMKAGLDANDWRSDCQFQVFDAFEWKE